MRRVLIGLLMLPTHSPTNMMEKITFSNLDKSKGERASGSENTLNSENEESFNRFIDASDSLTNQYLSSYPENPPELHKTPLNINSILNKDNSVFLSNELMSPKETDPPLSSTLTSPKTTSKTENSNFLDDESLFYSQSRFAKHSHSSILSNLPINQTTPIQLQEKMASSPPLCYQKIPDEFSDKNSFNIGNTNLIEMRTENSAPGNK